MAVVTKVLQDQAGIQYDGVHDYSEADPRDSLINTVIAGEFKRGRFDTPMKVTADNLRATLGYDPDNLKYMAIEDMLNTGAPFVWVMRVSSIKPLSCVWRTVDEITAFNVDQDTGVYVRSGTSSIFDFNSFAPTQDGLLASIDSIQSMKTYFFANDMNQGNNIGRVYAGVYDFSSYLADFRQYAIDNFSAYSGSWFLSYPAVPAGTLVSTATPELQAIIASLDAAIGDGKTSSKYNLDICTEVVTKLDANGNNVAVQTYWARLYQYSTGRTAIVASIEMDTETCMKLSETQQPYVARMSGGKDAWTPDNYPYNDASHAMLLGEGTMSALSASMGTMGYIAV